MAAKIDIVSEDIQPGTRAAKGSRVTYSARFYLNRGDEVTADHKSIEMYGDRLPTRLIDGVELIAHTTTLGKRQSIAGIEIALTGMTAGSVREVVIPPHLAYGDKGLGPIPPHALLRAKVWVHDVA